MKHPEETPQSFAHCSPSSAHQVHCGGTRLPGFVAVGVPSVVSTPVDTIHPNDAVEFRPAADVSSCSSPRYTRIQWGDEIIHSNVFIPERRNPHLLTCNPWQFCCTTICTDRSLDDLLALALEPIVRWKSTRGPSLLPGYGDLSLVASCVESSYPVLMK
eukprot:scpid6070/ scgid23068/ 